MATRPRVCRASVTASGAGSTVELDATSSLDVPYFGGVVRLVTGRAMGSGLRDAARRILAAAADEPPPAPPRRIPFLPPVPFSPEQAGRLAAVALVGALANFSGSLLTQNGDAVTDSFHRTDEALGFALALSRIGVLFALVASALADRVGRRRLILGGLATAAIANGVAAIAPSFEVFTASQVVTRAALQCTAVIASVAAIEDAPEGARAYALSLFALALGLGFALSVVLLPLADLGDNGWRIAFAVSAATLILLPSLRRNLHETRRYRALTKRTRTRGRVGEVFDREYGGRFVLLGLGRVPHERVRGAVVAALESLPDRHPRLLELARSRCSAGSPRVCPASSGSSSRVGSPSRGAAGRSRSSACSWRRSSRSSSSWATARSSGLHRRSPSSRLRVSASPLGTVNTELFPTEVRGTSNGFLLVCGVAGSALGLLLGDAAQGRASAVSGRASRSAAIAPLVAAVVPAPPPARDTGPYARRGQPVGDLTRRQPETR